MLRIPTETAMARVPGSAETFSSNSGEQVVFPDFVVVVEDLEKYARVLMMRAKLSDAKV